MLTTSVPVDVVVNSPRQSPICGVSRVEKVWKLWLQTMSVGNPAAKRQLPFVHSLLYFKMTLKCATV